MRDNEQKSRKLAKQLRQKMPNAEALLWTRLRRRQLAGFHFRRQHPIGAYVADFACIEGSLVIEVDGPSHTRDAEIARDKRRAAYLEGEGWSIYRVWNHEVYDHLEDVIDGIAAALPPSTASRSPSPVNGGGIKNGDQSSPVHGGGGRAKPAGGGQSHV